MRGAGGEDAEFRGAVVAAGVDAEERAAFVLDVAHPADDEDVGEAVESVECGGEFPAEDEFGLDLGPDAAGGVADAVADDGDGGEVVDAVGEVAEGFFAGLGGTGEVEALAPVGHWWAILRW